MKVDHAATLLEFLMEKKAAATRSGAKQMIRLGKVLVNGLPALKADEMLKRGQTLEIVKRSTLPPRLQKITQTFDHPILYEDKFLVAMVKPAGMLAVRVKGSKDPDLFSIAKAHFSTRAEDPCELHYIHGHDRAMSGIMLFAKNELTKKTMKMFWNAIVKRYVCLVEGAPAEDNGRVTTPLHESKKAVPVHLMKPSHTVYKKLKSFKEHTLLEVEPSFEQKYQIRRHLAELGCPVVGDKLNGAKGDPMRRLAIHLFHITFPHPVNKEKIKVTTPFPQEFTSYAKFGK